MGTTETVVGHCPARVPADLCIGSLLSCIYFLFSFPLIFQLGNCLLGIRIKQGPKCCLCVDL